MFANTSKRKKWNQNHVRLATINGVTKCIRDWCKEIGVNEGMVRSRLKRGWNEVDALTKPYVPYSERQKRSAFRLMCDANGLKPQTVYARIARGEEGEKIFAKVNSMTGLESVTSKPVMVNGEKMTRTEASKKLGVSVSAITLRIKSGWREEDSVTIPKVEEQDRPGRARIARRRKELASMGIVI